MTKTAYAFTTHTAKQTRALGCCLGRRLNKGTLLRLEGDLGSGKTCFVQGLARGLDIAEAYDIVSPTYTLVNEYPGRLTLFHIDLYRLTDIMDAEAIGLWEILEYNAVAAVEWADRMDDREWPAEALRIGFRILEGDSRSIRFIGSGLQTDSLIKNLVTSYSPEAS